MSNGAQVVLGASGEPCFAVDPGLRPRRLPPLQGDGKQLLSRLMSLSGACRQAFPIENGLNFIDSH